jgi:hypothetical protein
MSPEECTLVGYEKDVQEDPRMMDLKGLETHQMKSVSKEPVTCTQNVKNFLFRNISNTTDLREYIT